MKPLRNILIASDFSPASRPAFRRALDLARTNEAALWIAHVAALPMPLSPDGYVLPRMYDEMAQAIRADAEKRLRRLLDRARRVSVRGRALLLKGVPHDAIVRARAMIDGSGWKPFGAAIATRIPAAAPASAYELAMLFAPSPTYASDRPSVDPYTCRIVSRSASS